MEEEDNNDLDPNKDFMVEIQEKIKNDIIEQDSREKKLEEIFDVINTIKKRVFSSIEETKNEMIRLNDEGKKVNAALTAFLSIQTFLIELESSAAKQTKYQAGIAHGMRVCGRVISTADEIEARRSVGEHPEKLSEKRTQQ